MEKDLIKIFKSIKHIDKRFSVSNVGDELKELDYCFTIYAICFIPNLVEFTAKIRRMDELS